ncbi:LmbU [Streptomyces sp. SID4928]|nr:LmbU [Streptomyces sp. SID4928]
MRFARPVSFAAWEAAGVKIARAHDSSAWCLGDWIVYGQARYENRYKQAVEAAGLDYQTIRNYAWVARRFDLSRRRESLSFQHHAEVASLATQELQDKWLDLAETHRWSRNELRRRIRGSKPAHPQTSGARVLRGLDATAEQTERWREAADQSGSPLDAWILNQLDRAARRELEAESTVSRGSGRP